MFGIFLNNVVLQLVYFVVIIYAVGFVISWINRLFYGLFNNSRAVCYGTGFIGTPVHELSHALMCVVFLHKIEEIKLFQVDDENGVLGYVRHSYNKKNIWQVVGNYFIGVAPIVVGAALIYLLSKYALPTTFVTMTNNIEALIALEGDELSLGSLEYIFTILENIFKSFISELTESFSAWLFLLFALCISLHMNLSGADIKGSLTALPILAVVLAVVNAVFCFIVKSVYSDFIYAITSAGSYIICLLCLSMALSLLCLLAGLLIKGGTKAVKMIPKFKR